MMLMSLGAARGASVTVSGESGDTSVIDQIADAIAQGLDD